MRNLRIRYSRTILPDSRPLLQRIEDVGPTKVSLKKCATLFPLPFAREEGNSTVPQSPSSFGESVGERAGVRESRRGYDPHSSDTHCLQWGVYPKGGTIAERYRRLTTANHVVEINGSPSEKVIGALIVGTAVPFEERVWFVGFPCGYNGRPIMEKQFGGTKTKAQVFDNGSYL